MKNNEKITWKRIILVFSVLLAIGALSSGTEETSASKISNSLTEGVLSSIEEVKVDICDGIKVTDDCELEDVKYEVYLFHEKVEEESHVETKTTYVNEITGHCTLCKDGTYSPSCATGRGACSSHGGVAQWNAPIYGRVAHYEDIKIIDTPYKEAYYEKVLQE